MKRQAIKIIINGISWDDIVFIIMRIKKSFAENIINGGIPLRLEKIILASQNFIVLEEKFFIFINLIIIRVIHKDNLYIERNKNEEKIDLNVLIINHPLLFKEDRTIKDFIEIFLYILDKGDKIDKILKRIINFLGIKNVIK